MNDDDFLIQQRKSPRGEFATDLYQRINNPMPKQSMLDMTIWRRPALAFGAMALLLLVTLLVSPAARTFAGTQLHQIGAILLRADDGTMPAEPQPTIPAPVANTSQQADTLAQASSLAGFTVLAPAHLPTGYSQDGAWSVRQDGSGVYVVSAYGVDNGRHFLIMNQTQFADGALFEQTYADNETVFEVMIGGTGGVFISGRFMAHPNRPAMSGDQPELLLTNWLIWEANGVTYTLFGDDLEQNELIHVAESLNR